MNPNADLLSDLNAVTLEEENWREVIKATIEAYAKGDYHKLTDVIEALQFHNHTPDEAKAIIFRLQALGLMIKNNDLKDWIRLYETGAVRSVQKALISATAQHPLSLIRGDILFEKESFLKRVLELADSAGERRN
jgi:hypothetical protein